MAININASNQILNFSRQNNLRISVPPPNCAVAVCSQFACGFIEQATRKQIAQREFLFVQDELSVSSMPVMYNAILGLLPGSLLGIFRKSDSRIIHYVVKLAVNNVIGMAS